MHRGWDGGTSDLIVGNDEGPIPFQVRIMEPSLITGTSIVQLGARDIVFRLCRECRSKIVAITQEDNDMLLYCAKCEDTVSHFQASYAAELTCYQDGLLVNYKVYDALEALLGCDASTYCEVNQTRVWID